MDGEPHLLDGAPFRPFQDADSVQHALETRLERDEIALRDGAGSSKVSSALPPPL